MRIVNLSSGSKANSTFICYNNTKILIDAGLNETKLVQYLKDIGEDIKNIQAVFVTHEHVDHVRAIKNLAKKYDMKFYVHKDLESNGCFCDIKFKHSAFQPFDKEIIEFGELQIQPFDVSHDAKHTVGFLVNVKGSKTKAGFATDLGFVSETVKNALTGAKIVFLESNYDETMLKNGKYPFMLKQRILGNKGHLSNADSLELAKYLYKMGTKCFVLSHISENNNTYELAYKNYVDYFEANNIKLDKDVFVRVSFQEKLGNNFELKEDYNE